MNTYPNTPDMSKDGHKTEKEGCILAESCQKYGDVQICCNSKEVRKILDILKAQEAEQAASEEEMNEVEERSPEEEGGDGKSSPYRNR
jgi:hypothetical protein